MVVALVGVQLGLVNPLHQVRVNDHGFAVVSNPRSGHVVGEGAVRIVIAGEHVVALRSRLLSDSVELVPVSQRFLHCIGIVGAQHVLGDGTAIREQAGGRLPGDSLQLAISGGGDFLRVLVLAGQIFVRQADVRLHVQRVGGIDVLQSVVSFDQEDVDLVVSRGGFLRAQGFVQLVLVVVALVGVDRPLDDGAIVQGGGGLILSNFLHFGIVGVEAALEFIVPAPDVQHLALGGFRRCQRGRNDHHQAQKQSDELFHRIFLLFNGRVVPAIFPAASLPREYDVG